MDPAPRAHDRGRGGHAPPRRPPLVVSAANELPLGGTQRAIWAREVLQPGTVANIVSHAVRIPTAVDATMFGHAFEHVVARNDALRTTFSERNGVPVQVVHETMPSALDVRSVEGLDDAAFAEVVSAAATAPFDLAAGPLIRLTLFRRSATDHLLLASAHHIVVDMWTIALFSHELGTTYSALSGVPTRPLRKPGRLSDAVSAETDYVVSERGRRDLEFWRAELADAPSGGALPRDRELSWGTDHRGAIEPVGLTVDDARRVRDLAKRLGVPPASVILTCLADTLGRWTGTHDRTVGMLRANRSAHNARVMGCFVNPVAVRCETALDASIADTVRTIDAASSRAAVHGRFPFNDLVADLRPPTDPGTTPWFQAVMSWQKTSRLLDAKLATNLALDTGRGHAALGHLPAEPWELGERAAPYDLTLLAADDGDRLVAAIEYRVGLYEHETMRAFAASLAAIVRAVVTADLATPLRDLTLMTPDEHADTVELSRARASVDLGEGATTVHQLVEQQAQRDPDALAVVGEHGSHTYAALQRQVAAWATRLHDLGVEPGHRVAVHLDRTVDLPAALLAILRAGATYVPLDHGWPAERLRSITDRVGARAVLLSRPAAWVPDEVSSITIDALAVLPDQPGRTTSAASDDERAVAYVIHTSGSTGEPKGVIVEHRQLLERYRAWLRRPGLRGDDIVLAITTISFDPSVVELLFPLMTGATVVVAPSGAAADPALIARLVDEHAVSIMQATPTTWRMLVEDGFAGAPDLVGLCGGETLTADLAAELVAICGRVWNLYGPTETTIWATAHPVTLDDRPVPLGDPLDGTAMYVLDPCGRLVPPGMPGELWIGGAGVTYGYLGHDELTTSRFTDDPFAGGRMYATGDRVRRRLDGALLYLGRTDDQLKIRGNRIEPAEVEAVLLAHPAIAGAAVTTTELGPGDVRLVAHVVARDAATLDVEAIRSHARSRLPESLVPSHIVEASTLPTTPSGKLDRAALPDVVPMPASGRDDAPLEGQLAAIAEIWCRVLGVDDVGPHDDFFDLGGHSLLATQIVSRMRRSLQLDAQVRDVFDTRTLVALARRVNGRAALSTDVRDDAITSAPDGAPRPLSHSEQRMWLVHQLDPDGAAYNLAAAVDIIGTFDLGAIEWAINRLIERHETLRSVYGSVDGVPFQRVTPHRDMILEIVDHSALDPDDRERAIDDAARTVARQPFDLSTGPLIRFTVHRSAPDHHTLVMWMHHIVSDQWAFGVIARELSELYRARRSGEPSTLAPVSLSLARLADEQRADLHSREIERQLRYWREHLADLPRLDLPTDRQRPPIRTSRGATITETIPSEIVEPLDRLCRDLGATPFMVMLAAFDVVLSRYTSIDDIVVGTPIANRHRFEVEDVISSIVNTIVMRIDVGGDVTFGDLVERVRQRSLEAYERQDVPFDRLVGELQPARDLSRSPLFQVFFNVQNAPITLPRLDGADVAFRPIQRDAAQFDISLTIDTAVAGTATIEYSTDLFDPDRMHRLLGHFWTVLRAGLGDPTTPVAELPILTDDELEELGAHATTATSSASCAHELFAGWVRRTPDAVAVVSDDRTLTYAELDDLADSVASGLRTSGIGAGDVVGILMERSVDAIATVLGIWKTRAAYVPLDRGLPPDRVAFIADDVDLRLIVTDSSETACSAPILDSIDAPTSTVARLVSSAGPAAANPPDVRPDDLAYVIYTSGSTGRPKGVEVEHRHLAAFSTSFAARLGVGADDRILTTTTLTFDPSLVEFVLPLTIGGRVLVVGRDTSIDPRALIASIERLRPTLVQATPTTWNMLLRAGWSGADDLTALCGGEIMPRTLADAVRERTRRLWNLYGPTETTVWATAHEVGPTEDPVPIGAPLDGVATRVVDGHGRLVPIGVPGELWIGGAMVARGYRARAELTRERFVTDPFSADPDQRAYRTGDIVVRRAGGTLRFIGRADHQVKLRGIRIELGEIESVLAEHPAVAEAAVTIHPDPHGDDRLVGYVVLEADLDHAPSMQELQSRAARQLPRHLVPPIIVTVDEWPLTSSNKIDRRALPSPTTMVAAERRSTAAMSSTEARVCEIWEHVLGLGAVDRDDDFFDLGGHSLLALRVVAELERLTGTPVPVTALFQSPTPALLARRLNEGGWRSPHTSLIPIKPTGTRRPFFHVAPYQITALSFASLGRHFDADQPCYVLQPQGIDGPAPAHGSVEEIASHYLSEVRDVQPDGPYSIGGHCSGAPVALEMARQLEQVGETVKLLVVVDADPPAVERPSASRIGYLTGRVRHYWRGGRLLDAARWQLGLAVQRLLLARFGRRHQRRIARVRRAHALAHRAYDGAVVNCDGLFVRSAEWASLADKQWQDRWSEVITGRLPTVVVPGTHAGLVLNRNAAELAHVIEDAIASES